MKKSLLIAVLFLGLLSTAHAQKKSKDTSDGQTSSVAAALSRGADLEKRTENIQKGLDGLLGNAPSGLKKKLGGLSKGVSNLLNAEKNIKKMGGTQESSK